MVLPSGYRFFRDDALLKLREEKTRICKRCDQLYWIDDQKRKETFTTDDDYCTECISLFEGRVRLLGKENRPKAGCPIDTIDFIFTKKYHIASGRGIKQYYKNRRKWYEEDEKEYQNELEKSKKENFEKLLKKQSTLYKKLIKIKKGD